MIIITDNPKKIRENVTKMWVWHKDFHIFIIDCNKNIVWSVKNKKITDIKFEIEDEENVKVVKSTRTREPLLFYRL